MKGLHRSGWAICRRRELAREPQHLHKWIETELSVLAKELPDVFASSLSWRMVSFFARKLILKQKKDYACTHPFAARELVKIMQRVHHKDWSREQRGNILAQQTLPTFPTSAG
jgi:hypothetical protein